MAQDLTNGLGGTISVTSTATMYRLSPAPSNGGGNSEYANTLKITNTGSSTIYVVVGLLEASEFVEATAVPVAAGNDFWFVSGRKPIKNFVIACASGDTSTVDYGAY